MKTTHAAPILNRSGVIPADGWYHIEVTGTHPAGADRKQVIDEKCIRSIVNRFNADKAEAGDHWAGMLVDLDHMSRDAAHTTEAQGWLQEVEIRNNTKGVPQLWGRIDLTDLGEASIKNKRVKWFSTEYAPEDLEDAGNGNVRPLRLDGLAFTNRPNNRGGKPISNRTGTPPDGPKPETETNKPMLNNIATALGLSADADEAAIIKAIGTLKTQCTDADTKNKENEADAVMNRFGDRIPEGARAGFRAQLIANRADTEKLMDVSFPEKAEDKNKAQAPIHNRSTATHPAPVSDGKTAEAEAAGAKKAAAIRNRASEIQSRERIPFNQAFARASAELS